MTNETLSRLERSINKKLKRISPRYGIRHLAQSSDGRYLFDLKVAIDPRHFSELRDVLKSVLSELPVERSVQAKFYLPESVYARVKERAAAIGVSQSAYVAECLSRQR